MTAHEDAKAIRDAIKGLGTDDAKLISVVTKRSNEHLVAVTADYTSSFGKSIFDDIKGDTSGDYRDLLIGLVESRPNYIAKTVHNAIKGLGTNEGALIDAVVHQSNASLKAAAEAYHKLFNKSIVEAVASDLSGDLKHLIVGLLAGNRDESPNVNLALAQTDADNLYSKGEGKIGTDEDAFVEFFLGRSFAHIREVNRLYQEKRGHDLVAAIDGEFSGYLRRALKALAVPREQYWAGRAYKALSGLGTNDSGLIRTFVFNDRNQLKAVEATYKAHQERKASGKKAPASSKGKKDEKKDKKPAPAKKSNGSLVEDIKNDTSGNFEKALLSLLV